MTSRRILEVRDLRLEGPDGIILDGVRFDIGAGEVVGLRGPSGAGKSVLAATLAGRSPPGVRRTGGEIAFHGEAIGWAMQDATEALDPLRRIDAELRVTLAAHRRPIDLQRWTAAVGLTPAQAARRPSGLSGGQRQRAVLALAICVEPTLLLADEPTASLDPVSRARIGALLRDMTRQGDRAVLLISHDAAFLASVADRIVTWPGSPPSPWRPLARREPGDAPDGEPVLRLSDVSFAHGPARVLDRVNLRIHRGRTLAMVGPSGGGKTTAARIAAGLLVPSSGAVARCGDVAMVFQDAQGSLDPFWSVGRSIGEPLPRALNRPERDRNILALLRSVGLSGDVARLRPARLSGGQRQRVAIARALAARPALLVCDEPISALDPRARDRILDVLLEAQARDGFAMLLASHDVATVAGLAHEVRRMEDGRLSPPEEIG